MMEWELTKEEIGEVYENGSERALDLDCTMGEAIDAGKAEIAQVAQMRLARWVLRQRRDCSFSYQDSQFSKLIKWLEE